jgi:hypothetical protein
MKHCVSTQNIEIYVRIFFPNRFKILKFIFSKKKYNFLLPTQQLTYLAIDNTMVYAISAEQNAKITTEGPNK